MREMSDNLKELRTPVTEIEIASVLDIGPFGDKVLTQKGRMVIRRIAFELTLLRDRLSRLEAVYDAAKKYVTPFTGMRTNGGEDWAEKKVQMEELRKAIEEAGNG